MLTHPLLFSLNYFLQKEWESCHIWVMPVRRAVRKLDIVNGALISLLNNLNMAIQIILQSQNKLKQNKFLVTSKFIFIDYLEKNSKVAKENKELTVPNIEIQNMEAMVHVFIQKDARYEGRKIVQECILLGCCTQERLIRVTSICLKEKLFFLCTIIIINLCLLVWIKLKAVWTCSGDI